VRRLASRLAAVHAAAYSLATVIPYPGEKGICFPIRRVLCERTQFAAGA
jgi:hypothetical protein